MTGSDPTAASNASAVCAPRLSDLNECEVVVSEGGSGVWLLRRRGGSRPDGALVCNLFKTEKAQKQNMLE